MLNPVVSLYYMNPVVFLYYMNHYNTQLAFKNNCATLNQNTI